MSGGPVSGLRQQLPVYFEKARAGEQLKIARRDSMPTQPASRSRVARIMIADRAP
jgi:hypothetical protein